MEKLSIYLNGIKSGCFVLLTCLSLAFATTSCNNDEFELNEPQQQKQYTKAELIELALSRMPRTRANNSRFEMVTIKDTVSLRFKTTEDIEIHWEDSITYVTADSDIEETHIFTDDFPSHYIRIIGSEVAIQSLTIDDNKLISLNITKNTKLLHLTCEKNYLDELDLTGCPNLSTLRVSNNELSFVDLLQVPFIQVFEAKHNQLTSLDIPESLFLYALDIEDNLIKELDVSKNQQLTTLNVSSNPITDLDLSENTELMTIYLEHLPIKTLNNSPISDTSFFIFPMLWQLNVAYTPFNTLDLSHNPIIFELDISGTSITKLDISDLSIQILKATRSKLADLVYGENGLNKFSEVRIERTPFENDWDHLRLFVYALPNRIEIAPGHLYTYSPFMKEIYKIINSFNWFINE